MKKGSHFTPGQLARLAESQRRRRDETIGRFRTRPVIQGHEGRLSVRVFHARPRVLNRDLSLMNDLSALAPPGRLDHDTGSRFTEITETPAVAGALSQSCESDFEAALEIPVSNPAESTDLEGGILLVRVGAEADQLRRRLERPARIGRFLMGGLGAVTAAAGVVVWIANVDVVGLALAIFGAVLVSLAVTQHVLLRRDLQHWPDQVVLRDDGVELFLRNGEVRGVAWMDSDFALNLISRAAPPPAGREYLLAWMPDPKIPSVELSADGFDRLVRAAEARHLAVTVRRSGRSGGETQLIEIGPGVESADRITRRTVETSFRQN
jgi:hypothetical protein